MANDFRGPQRPKSDPLESVSSFLTSLGGAFSEAFESVIDNIPGLDLDGEVKTGKLPAEVKFLEDGAIVKFDLPPAVTHSDVTVSLTKRLLDVSVIRNADENSESDFSDRPDNFYRGVELPSDRFWEPVSAEIRNGVLEVALASREAVRTYTIPVTSTVTNFG